MKDGKLIVVTGRTRSGKTLSTRRATAQETRLLVWDPKGKWAELDHCRALYTRQELFELAGAGAAGRFAFIGQDRATFNFWAEAAYWWGRVAALRGARSVIVAEELSAFTSAGKAPAGWHLLLTQGLEFGLDIWCLVQRPAESDKTCIGNATRLKCFAMTRALDCAYMARELDCDAAEIQALRPLEFIERDMVSGARTRGKIGDTLRKFGRAGAGAASAKPRRA